LTKKSDCKRFRKHFAVIAQRENHSKFRLTVAELFIRGANHHGRITKERARIDAKKFSVACNDRRIEAELPRYMRNYLKFLESPEVHAQEKRSRPQPSRERPKLILRDLSVAAS